MQIQYKLLNCESIILWNIKKKNLSNTIICIYSIKYMHYLRYFIRILIMYPRLLTISITILNRFTQIISIIFGIY